MENLLFFPFLKIGAHPCSLFHGSYATLLLHIKWLERDTLSLLVIFKVTSGYNLTVTQIEASLSAVLLSFPTGRLGDFRGRVPFRRGRHQTHADRRSVYQGNAALLKPGNGFTKFWGENLSLVSQYFQV